MSNLVPEARLDKNNRMVTRHVLPDAPAASGKSIAPSPTVHTTASKRGLKTLNALADRTQGINLALRTMFAGYSISTLEIIDNHDQNVRKLSLTDMYNVFNNENEVSIREYYAFAVDAFESEDDIFTTQRCIRGVRHYFPAEKMPDLTKASPELQEKFRPLIRIASIVHYWMAEEHPAAEQEHDSEKRIVNVIANKELVDLIMSHPDRGEDIAEFIKSRDSIDVPLIREMLEGDVPRSLHNGML